MMTMPDEEKNNADDSSSKIVEVVVLADKRAQPCTHEDELRAFGLLLSSFSSSDEDDDDFADNERATKRRRKEEEEDKETEDLNMDDEDEILHGGPNFLKSRGPHIAYEGERQASPVSLG